MFERLRQLEIVVHKIYCWIKTNLPNGTGTSAPRVIITSDEEYTFPNEVVTTILTFTGDSSTLILPSTADTEGLIIILTNAGSGDLYITSPEGVWEGGMVVEESMMSDGTTARIVNDGINYRINS